MCAVTIDPNVLAIPNSTGTVQVTVAGTYSNCASNNITVSVDCGAGSATVPALIVNPTAWEAVLQVNCPCGTQVNITVTCHDSPPCTAQLTTVLACGCCPSVKTDVNKGLYDSAGNYLVTFVTTLTFPAGCTVKVQRAFGDGFFGAVYTYTSSPQTLVETHAYAPGVGYGSMLNILNASCSTTADLTGIIAPAPLCATNYTVAVLCKMFQFLLLLSAAVAIVLLFVSPSSLCGAASYASLLWGFVIAGAVSLAFILLVCGKCVCGTISKLTGQLFVIVGLVFLLFATGINCAVPWYIPSTTAVIIVSLVLLYIGAYGLLYRSWYQPYETTCPLVICDYWQTLHDAATVALFAGLIVYSVPTMGIAWAALVPFLLLVAFVLAVTGQLVNFNQTAGNC